MVLFRVPQSGRDEIRLCLLLVAKFKGGFCSQKGVLINSLHRTSLIRTSQEGCEALLELFLTIVPRCRSFESSSERYPHAERVRVFLKFYHVVTLTNPAR